jgi:hypothetical protein
MVFDGEKVMNKEERAETGEVVVVNNMMKGSRRL